MSTPPPPADGHKIVLREDDYLEHVAELDLSPDQEREYIHAVFGIVTAFVDLGFGIETPIDPNNPEEITAEDAALWDTDADIMLSLRESDLFEPYTEGGINVDDTLT